jgi:hypothetical protein
VGVALFPHLCKIFRAKGVVYKDLQDETFEIEMALVWRRYDTSPVLQSFVKVADTQE